MEQLRAELSHLLGEKLSRIECVNEKSGYGVVGFV